jgi:putative membrane protein
MVTAQRPWWDHMWGATDAWGWMMFMMLFWVVVLFLLVWLVFRLARSQGWIDGAAGRPDRGGGAEEILRERYARGEIDRETYMRMLEDLRRGENG